MGFDSAAGTQQCEGLTGTLSPVNHREAKAFAPVQFFSQRFGGW
jgi:hypothetical protein